MDWGFLCYNYQFTVFPILISNMGFKRCSLLLNLTLVKEVKALLFMKGGGGKIFHNVKDK